MKTIKTEWKTQNTFDGVPCVKKLFVNEQETNIYYFTPSYKHFDMQGPEQMRKAQDEELLIKQGKIYPQNGDFTGFDICASYHIKPAQFEVLNEEQDINFWNRILTCTGREPIREDVIKEITKSPIHTQFTKAVNRQTGEFLTKIAVKFYPYGWAIGFIS